MYNVKASFYSHFYNSLLTDTLVKHHLELVPSGRPRPSDKGGGGVGPAIQTLR